MPIRDNFLGSEVEDGIAIQLSMAIPTIIKAVEMMS
jgi:hypothetical protein